MILITARHFWEWWSFVLGIYISTFCSIDLHPFHGHLGPGRISFLNKTSFVLCRWWFFCLNNPSMMKVHYQNIKNKMWWSIIHGLDNGFSNSLFIHGVIFFSDWSKSMQPYLLLSQDPIIDRHSLYSIFLGGGWQSEKTAWTHKTQQRSHYINGSNMKRSNMFVWLKLFIRTVHSIFRYSFVYTIHSIHIYIYICFIFIYIYVSI